MTPTPVGWFVHLLSFTINTGCMGWLPTGADQNQDFILSLFSLTIIVHPKKGDTDNQQATNNQ